MADENPRKTPNSSVWLAIAREDMYNFIFFPYTL
jgi:hypothetical protein